MYGKCERFRSDCRPCPLLRAPANRWLAANELSRKVLAYRAVDARLVANSRWLRDVLQGSAAFRGQEIAVVPPPVDPAVFRPLDRNACRAQLGLDKDALVVATGCASLSDSNKDTYGLLCMLAELRYEGLKVLMFGDGGIPIPDTLDVRRLGPIRDNRELAAIYGAADLFASASKMETYGLTLAEAYACGCAVVAHDTGGIPEALPRDDSVALSGVGDRTAFMSALRAQFRRCVEGRSAGEIDRLAPCAPSSREAIEVLASVYVDR